MAAKSPAQQAPTNLHVETLFHIGDHLLSVEKVMEGRWSIAVDGGTLSSTFRTQADAWEAGVREADRLDRAAG